MFSIIAVGFTNRVSVKYGKILLGGDKIWSTATKRDILLYAFNQIGFIYGL